MELPPYRGLADPIFMCELALRLGMPVGEMCSRMTAHELTVMWPAYFQVEADRRKREERDRAIRERRHF